MKTYKYDGKEFTAQEIQVLISNSLKNRSTRIAKMLEFLEPCDSLLDIGCGAGDITYLMAETGKPKNVLGIDILPESIEISRDFFSLPNLKYEILNIFNQNFPTNSFDCVTWFECIEHVDNPVAFLREIHRILKPNGILIISTPNALSLDAIFKLMPTYFLRKLIGKRLDAINTEPKGTGTQFDHIYTWDMPTLYRLCHRNGFIYDAHAFVGAWPIRLRIKGISVPVFPLWKTNKDSNCRAKILGPFCNSLLLKVRKKIE